MASPLEKLLQDVPGHKLDVSYDESKPLNGLLLRLKKMNNNQNLHETIVVKVILSERWDTSVHPVIDVDTDAITASGPSVDSWIAYDFGPSGRITPTSYTLKTRTNYERWPNTPHSWVIETSVDGIHWEMIDVQVNVESVKKSLAVNHFTMKRSPTPCRYVRIARIQPNESGASGICISAFELFGSCEIVSSET